MRKCEYAEMKWPLWILIIAFLPACEIDDLPLETRDEAKVWVQQPPLFTDVRVEPDQVWEKQIGGRNISWRYNSIKEELEKSILIIGIFEITFFNTNIDQAVNAEVMINLIGADGFRHLPQTPFKRVSIAAGDTTLATENFILEVKDIKTANDIVRMDIDIF